MTASIEAMTKDWPGTVVLIQRPGEPGMLRMGAAFVFDLPAPHGGFGWLSPAFYDPEAGGSPIDHYYPGAEWEPAGSDIAFTLGNGDRGYLYRYAHGSSPLDEGLEWFRAHLDAKGTTLEAEHERVRAKFMQAWEKVQQSMF